MLPTSPLVTVGQDKLSDDLAQFMRESGITPQLVQLAEATLGLYMIQTHNGERSFSYWRSTSAARQLASHLDQLPNLSRGDTVLFSGITVAILPDAGRAALLERLAALRQAGICVVFDPNLRPRLWNTQGDMCNWVTRAAEASNIILPSHEDEAQFFGDADPQATAQRYLSLGAELVVVKDGANDVLVAPAGQPTSAITPQAVQSVVDTTAAGDSFNAGFLHAIQQGHSLTDAVAKACALSAHVIGHRGALVAPG